MHALTEVERTVGWEIAELMKREDKEAKKR